MAGLFIMGLGVAGVSPTLVAYMSHILPFKRRSRGLGILEYTWALVGIVMLPLFGWLIEGVSWRLPFLLMGLLEMMAIFGFRYLPRIIQPGKTTNSKRKRSPPLVETGFLMAK